ncbi:MAG: class I SAM-dependent methyltransferase [Anaerolineae bacterium]|nr:class I SAM-dependent methyltransferase [Anaerolineae bacterium]
MFNAPMSLSRADDLIKALDLPPRSTVVDLGCGDGTFLCRLAAQTSIAAVGIDNDDTLIRQARKQWTNRISASEVKFIDGDAAHYFTEMAPVDAIICIGAEFIFGGYRELLEGAVQRLNPNGRMLLGTLYWKQDPPADYLALMGGENPHVDLSTTVTATYETGFMPLAIHRSNADEWDAFESHHARKRYLSAVESGQPDMRERAWQWQSGYLKWGMSTMGFCFLILQKI